jgi:transposase
MVENKDAIKIRKSTVEHPYGTLKYWMGYTHFQLITLKKVRAEMSLHVLAYNLKRVINIMGTVQIMEAIRA